MYYYSAKINAFYPEIMMTDYKASNSWPDDVIQVDEDIYIEFAATEPPPGKIRAADKKGSPCWIDIPPVSKEELIEQAEAKKQYLIAEVHTETEMLRTKLALGRIKENEKAQLNAWLDYLDELEAVDVSTAPDIIWPVKPVA